MIKLNKLVEAINNAAEIANATLVDSHDQVINNFFDQDEESGKYKAKSISIEHPTTTPEGKLKLVNIDVPLITVVPISSARIELMKFTTVLDVAIENDELMVSFSPHGRAGEAGEPGGAQQATATLELMIQPQANTEGLTKLIEGYEKALRAQIPG